MEAPEAGLRRVSVHYGSAVLDVALPAGLPVALLIPSIVDLLGRHVAARDIEARRLALAPPGAAPLDLATTLAQNGVDDGAVLILGRSSPAPVIPHHLDAAGAVSAALEASPARRPSRTRPVGAVAAVSLTAAGGLALVRHSMGGNTFGDAGGTVAVLAAAAVVAVGLGAVARRTHRDSAAGLGMSVLATAFGALAGFVAVPGAAGVSHVLLSAAVTAVTAVTALRACGGGGVVLAAVTTAAVIVALTALAGVVSGAPPRALGSVAALASVALLGVAARAAIALAGLTPRSPPDGNDADTDTGAIRLSAQAIRADEWLTSLSAGLAAAAAIGAVVTTIAGTPRPSCTAFGVATGGLLLLRARGAGGKRMPIYAAAGIGTAATTFGAVAVRAPAHGPWIAAATAALAAAALHLGVTAPTMACSPVARRAVELLECAVLVALVPLTGWICGAYAVVRGVPLR